MSNDAKFFMFMCGCVVLVITAITIGVGYSNYQYTIRMRDCITAGYEFVKVPASEQMECKKVLLK